MMKLVVDSSGSRAPEAIELSDSYHMASELQELAYQREDMSEGKFRYFYTDGLVLIDAQTVSLKPLATKLTFDSHVIMMTFHFEGHSGAVSGAGEQHVAFREGGHNIRVVAGGMLELLFHPDQVANSFIVILSKEFFLRVMPQEYDKYMNLFNAVDQGTDMTLFPDTQFLSQEMKRIVENVRNCSRKGSFHRLCLEIKIAELIMLQLEQYQLLYTGQLEKPMLHADDLDKIEQAKRILDENYSCPPTIKELATIIGVNETKLKADFKKIYQSTIHEYTVSLRMQEAYQLIMQQNLLIKEVALQVGYQKTSNFTKVFREFYGVSPRQTAIDKKA